MSMVKAALSLIFVLAVTAASVPIAAGPPESEPDNLFNDAVWIATPTTAIRIDSTRNAVASELEGAIEVRAVDADYRSGTLWVYGGGVLSQFDFNGMPVLSLAVDLSAGSADQHLDLAVDSENALIWLAVKRQLFLYDTAGQLLAAHGLEQDVQAITLDTGRQQAWVATERTVSAFDAFTGPVETIQVEEADRLVDLAFDADRNRLWFVTEKGVLQQIDRETLRPQLTGNAPGRARKMVLDSTGSVWLATDDALAHLDSEGNEEFRVPLPSNKPPVDLVVNKADGSAWVATLDAIRHVAMDGTVLVTLEMASDRKADKIQDLAGYEDLIPPTISVQSPVGGSFLSDSTPTIEVGYSDIGTGIDPGSLSVTVDGELRQTVCVFDSLPGVCELVTPLAEGGHLLELTISDYRGNRSSAVSVAVVIDTVPPSPIDPSLVRVNGPLDGSVLIEAQPGAAEAEATVRISNTRSGELMEVVAGSNGSFQAGIAAIGGDSLGFVAIDRAGNASSETLVQVTDLELTISFPVDGSEVDGRYIQVRGTVEGPENTGVSVNGVVALIDGETFIADRVPLTAGENTIRATASAASGASISEEVQVTSNGLHPLMKLTASVRSGIAPLTVSFRVQFFVDQKIAITLQDLDGDGNDDRAPRGGGFGGGGFGGPSFVPPSPIEVDKTLTDPGIYVAQIIVELEDGTILTETITLQVLDIAALDSQLMNIWDNVFNAVSAGNIEAALNLMTSSGQSKYRRVFEALSEDMENILQDFSRPELMSAAGGIGEYAVVRLQNGARQVFLVYFLQGADGVWRLDTL